MTTNIIPKFGNVDIFQQFPSISRLLSEVEYELVKRGHREVDVYHISPMDFDEKIKKIVDDGLTWRPIYRIKWFSGFSFKHEFTESMDNNTLVYGVVGKDPESLKNFEYYSHQGTKEAEKEMGLLLDYPECCSEFFGTSWIDGHKDLLPLIVQNSDYTRTEDDNYLITGYNVLLTEHMKYFGPRIISWMPCSFECEESIKRAELWESIARDIDPNLTDYIIQVLKCPSEWSVLNQYIHVDHPMFKGYLSKADYPIDYSFKVEFIP